MSERGASAARLGRLYDGFTRWAVGTIFLVMVAVTTAGVFARYVLNDSLVWADTVAVWLFAWVTFLGSALAIRHGAHMAVDVLQASLPPLLAKPSRVFVEVAVLAAAIFLVISGYELVQVTGQSRSPATGIRQAFGMSAVPVGAAFMVVDGLRRLVAVIRRPAAEGAPGPASFGPVDPLHQADES